MNKCKLYTLLLAISLINTQASEKPMGFGTGHYKQVLKRGSISSEKGGKPQVDTSSLNQPPNTEQPSQSLLTDTNASSASQNVNNNKNNDNVNLSDVNQQTPQRGTSNIPMQDDEKEVDYIDVFNRFRQELADSPSYTLLYKMNGIYNHQFNLEFRKDISEKRIGIVYYNYENTNFLFRWAKNILISMPLSGMDYLINIPSNLLLCSEGSSSQDLGKDVQLNWFKTINRFVWTHDASNKELKEDIVKASMITQILAGLSVTMYHTLWGGVGFLNTLMFIGVGLGMGLASSIVGFLTTRIFVNFINHWLALVGGIALAGIAFYYMNRYVRGWVNTKKSNYIKDAYTKEVNKKAYEASSQTWKDWARSFFASSKNTDVSKPGMIMSYLYYAYEHYIITTAIVLTVVFGGGYLYTEKYAKKTGSTDTTNV